MSASGYHLGAEIKKKKDMLMWEKDDTSLIPDYDALIKQEFYFIIRKDTSIMYKVIQDDKVIEYQKRYIPKKDNPDLDRTLITFYRIDNSTGKKIFICRIIFFSEQIKAICINQAIQETTASYIDFGYRC